MWFDLNESMSRSEMLIRNIKLGYSLWGTLLWQNEMKITKAGITKSKNIKRILLSLKFIRRIPARLSSGNSEGKIKSAFSLVVSLRLEGEKVISLFLI